MYHPTERPSLEEESKLVPTRHHWSLFRKLQSELSFSDFLNRVDVNCRDIADICNVSVRTVQKWKTGERLPQWHHRFLFCLFFKIVQSR